MLPKEPILAAMLVAALVCLAPGCRKAPPSSRDASSDRAQTDHPADAAGNAGTPPALHVGAPPTDDEEGASTPSPALAEGEQSPRSQLLAVLSEQVTQAFLAGERALADGDCESAAASFARAVRLHPDNVALLQTLSEALVAAGHHDRAIDTYERILVLDEHDLDTMYNLAVAYTRLEDYHQAEQTYRRLLRIDERHLRARFNLAGVYRAQGKLEAARGAWLACVQQDDSHAEAHALLGEVLLQLQQPEAALPYLRRASALAPNDLATHLHLAAAAKLTGSYGWAATALKRATQLAPDNAEVWADLGGVLLTIHRNAGRRKFLDEAIAAWERSLDIDPDQPALREYLATYRPGDRSTN